MDTPSDLAANVEEAAAALSRFDRYSAQVLGPSVPALGPIAAILLRTESASSSQIENLTVGARQLALAELDQSRSTNARAVVANVRTMEAALRLADRFDTNAILQMHRTLLIGQAGAEIHAGQWRDQLVWIGTSSVSPRGASHVAPQAPLVPAAIDDLVQFTRRNDLPILVQVAIAHAQFENIHPFVDGNGRTGRAMIHALLRAKGLVTSTTAPVSAGLPLRTEQYFDALDACRAGDARPIVERFADAARFAASSGSRLVDDLAAQIEAPSEQLSGLRRHALAWRVLPHLIAHPVINARFLTETLGMADQSAQNALRQLADAGVLAECTGLRRNRVWQHIGILTILDQYAQRLIRR
ncbi:Fic family protein [Ruania alkalisoli]|uniref:Fic family protein n=1 Tax=Ruania alkalisoli TaxID=2779775 RepID=UPI001FEB6679|nr:Fic family protein [Ruania alkalisoli]